MFNKELNVTPIAFPITSFLTMVIVAANPFKLFYRSSRLFFLKTFVSENKCFLIFKGEVLGSGVCVCKICGLLAWRSNDEYGGTAQRLELYGVLGVVHQE